MTIVTTVSLVKPIVVSDAGRSGSNRSAILCIPGEPMSHAAMDADTEFVCSLARRHALSFDEERSAALLAGGTVLVTGAGGSIGSSVVRSLLAGPVAKVVALERSEHEMYVLDRALQETPSTAEVVSALGDATDERLVSELFARHRPDVVIHAAAFKHASLLEHFPLAAILNNVESALVVARAAVAHGTRSIVAISSDKAADPAGVMGATKRAVERLLGVLEAPTTTIVSVRFGNVYGSRGSVVPLFLEQIRSGRPMTVTDADAARYFVSETESVGLILAALWVGRHSDVLVPDLGSPVRMGDLARTLAERFSSSGSDHPIVVTGLRDGEKTIETLVATDERLAATERCIGAARRCVARRRRRGDGAMGGRYRRRAARSRCRVGSGGSLRARARIPSVAICRTCRQRRDVDGGPALMTRTVAVVTTSRADFGHLYWPIRTLASDSEIELRLIATGPHLSPEFGLTIEGVGANGVAVDETIECLMSSDTDVGMAKTIGVATLGFADVLGRMRPDLLLVIADRYEMLAPVSVALALRIPVVHIEGGEVSEGAIDDAVRNALTKMSHVHLTTTEMARRRVIAMGEESWRVHRVGAPSLDHLTRCALHSRAELERRLDIDLTVAPVLVGHHPVTIARDTTRESAALYDALTMIGEPLVFCYPNADAGSRALIDRATAFCAEHARARVFVNLDHLTYWSLLGASSAIVGNSSSGIMEAASLGIPAVDVGLRQEGRERARNVLHANAEASDIIDKLRTALEPNFRRSIADVENPYGDGNASERILEVVRSVPLGEELLRKRPRDLDDGGTRV